MEKERHKATVKAIDLLGGQRPAAKATGFSQHAIWKAYQNVLVDGVNPQMAIALERATKGKVKRAELRPDVYQPRKPYTRKVA